MPEHPRPRWAAVTAAVSVAALALTSSVVPAPAARAQATCTAGSLTFAAHPDDDLIFMSPDLLEDVTGGSCSRTVYLTAGTPRWASSTGRVVRTGSGQPTPR